MAGWVDLGYVPGSAPAGIRTRDLPITSPTLYHYTTESTVMNSSSQALILGSLCKPTHRKCLWELCLSGAWQIGLIDLIYLFDWLVELLLGLPIIVLLRWTYIDTTGNWRPVVWLLLIKMSTMKSFNWYNSLLDSHIRGDPVPCWSFGKCFSWWIIVS